jgi:hypothetical protein
MVDAEYIGFGFHEPEIHVVVPKVDWRWISG